MNKSLIFSLLLLIATNAFGQFQNVTGTAQKNSTTGQYRWNFGANGVFNAAKIEDILSVDAGALHKVGNEVKDGNFGILGTLFVRGSGVINREARLNYYSIGVQSQQYQGNLFHRSLQFADTARVQHVTIYPQELDCNTCGISLLLPKGGGTLARVEDLPDISGKANLKTINVLAVGSSTIRDVMSYFPIFAKSIAPDVRVSLTIMYRSSATLKMLDSLVTYNIDGFSAETYNYNSTSYTIVPNSAINPTLSSKKWDLVMFTSSKDDVMFYETYFPYLPNLQKTISSRLGYNVKFGYITPPSYANDYWQLDPLNMNSEEMANKTIAQSERLIKDGVVSFVMPLSTAIQNARTHPDLDKLGDYGNLTFEGNHLQEGLPCTIAAYVASLTILKQFGYDNKGVLGDRTKALQSWVINNNIPGQHGESVGVTDENLYLAQLAATYATNNPFKVTPIIKTSFSTKAERDAYNVTTLPFYSLVKNDGSGKWLVSKATSTGVGAKYVTINTDYNEKNYNVFKEGLVDTVGFYSNNSITVSDFNWTLPINGISTVVGNDKPVTLTGMTYAPISFQKYHVIYGDSLGNINYVTTAPRRDYLFIQPTLPTNVAVLKVILVRGSIHEIYISTNFKFDGKDLTIQSFSTWETPSKTPTSVAFKMFANNVFASTGIGIGRRDGLGTNEVLLRVFDRSSTGTPDFTVVDNAGNYMSTATIGRENQVWDFKASPTINGLPLSSSLGLQNKANTDASNINVANYKTALNISDGSTLNNNISGTAAGATTWGQVNNNFNLTGTTLDYLAGMDLSVGQFRKFYAPQLKTYLSLPATGGYDLQSVSTRNNMVNTTLFLTGDVRPLGNPPSGFAGVAELRDDGAGGKVALYGTYDYSNARFANTAIGTINPNFGMVGIGTHIPTSKLAVNGGDIEVMSQEKGLILKSPNGTRWRITVNDSGSLVSTAL
ncbi:DUF4886 domain-containing protein [Pedobacter ureilyticus]|uniref:DUF4886 domain-containing protein n=1 Tax=Pedobacter ureilyticus TaxID=1393051 RepID=A0ABW9J1W0_9SPHI|nr:DUF4886 domain-containing protein [Pedobacter helvus]